MIFSKIMDILEWVMHFAYLNLLFIAGILVGGVVLGFFPACHATISVSQRLINEPGFNLTKAFIDGYKKHFWKSQRVGYLFLFVKLILVSNIIFWRQLDHLLSWIWLFLVAFLLLGSMLLFSISVENHFSLKDLGKLFFYSLSQLHLYLALLLGLVVIYLALLLVPGVFIFFAGSLSLTWVMFISHLFVQKIQKVQQRNRK